MAELLYRLGKFAARRVWTVIATWIVVLLVAGVGFAIGFKGLATSFDIPGTASSQVTDELAEKLPDFSGAAGTVVFSTEDGSALSADQQAAISAMVADAGDLPDVATVNDPFATERERADRAQQIEDGRAQIDDGRSQLEAGQAQLDAAQADVTAGQAQLDAARTQAEAAGAPEEQLAALDAQQAQLEAGQAQLDAQQAQIDSSTGELETQSATLEQGAELLDLAKGIRLVSEDGSTALVNIGFTEPRLELSPASKKAVVEHFTAEPIDGIEVAFSTEIAQGVPQILGVGEAIGVVIAGVVLLVMLGSIIAAALPLLTAIVGVAIGVLGVLAFSGVVQMASVTPVLGVMLGLAVGIDYSLFIINRHRKQLLQGLDVDESIGLANGTAGNAVVFAGTTVIVALLALNVTGIPFLGLMGTAGAVCVAVAVLIAISLTPALLSMVGERVLGRRARARIVRADAAPASAPAEPTRASRRERSVLRTKPIRPMSTLRSVLTIVVAIAALLVVAIPALSMRVGLPDGGSEPVESASYRAFTITEDAFGAGANSTILVTADLPSGLSDEDVVAQQLEIARSISDLDDVVAVAPIAVSDDGELAAFQVVPADGPNSVSTETLVRSLRELEPAGVDGPLGVAGQAAINIDISEGLTSILPIYLTVVVGLSLLIMIVVFRSLLVPVIATGGFILSLFATYGALVAVFQWGWFADLLGIHATGPILNFLPIILIGILFGLAMDYQLFLASGMREAYVHGSEARLAVAQGFRAGRSVVLAAGLIMIAVFGGFIFSESTIIRSLGFGLAFGILVDAFVVRMLLMPAIMHVLGRSAWWVPKWLDRILPNVDVEGAALERRHALHP
ncbi:MMPL family transporter [Microbacterium pygmaeum]|uniref:Putative drug exporter of the RND superfamily n=1 Tax=Microbacterium pygmaeum TaxID=370764 RepID=A0A1G7WEN5_9MICO|nr:MMPL family transporter [Microbacterium pygmaeum]SDG70304.1 putative drug exporter of the RND superfamily [Microbacterium pygmaeum]